MIMLGNRNFVPEEGSVGSDESSYIYLLSNHFIEQDIFGAVKRGNSISVVYVEKILFEYT